MNNESSRQVAPARLTAPLTITLSGSDLDHLNAYREAVHALLPANWPANAKHGVAPDKYRMQFEGQRDVAEEALAQILSNAVDAPPRSASE
ncbi:hypothetical protein JFU49_03400 [Pseudomonas sp. TH03]|uniref:hypothetical protein n=1 Tax=Pseudomonas sp. TH03 TaxID=2796369 RepID=UPI0019116F13|nr:hypothetical protein [Pseudomonas sp. TH03]MBK5549333.1 hypothetical protein [Pseudomonas sp. TH03]